MDEAYDRAVPAVPRSVLFELYVAGQLANELLARELEVDRLKVGPHALLLLIERDGPLTPTQLEAATGLRPSTLRERMQPLLDGEHVVRRPSAEDRRSHSFETTTRGRELIRRAAPAVEAADQGLVAQLDAGQIAGLRAVAEAARKALQQNYRENRDLT